MYIIYIVHIIICNIPSLYSFSTIFISFHYYHVEDTQLSSHSTDECSDTECVSYSTAFKTQGDVNLSKQYFLCCHPPKKYH